MDAILVSDLPVATKVQRFSEAQQRVLAHSAKARNLLTQTDLTEALEIASAPGTYKPKSPISTSAQARFASHFAEQNDNPRTRDVYLSNIKRFSAWLTTNGKELTFDTVAEYLDSVSKARQTRLGHLAALRKFHKWAIRYDQHYRDLFATKSSPLDGHTHARVGENAGESWTAYTQQEAERLHAAALANEDMDLADLIAFACFTGCRIEELGRIRRDTTLFDEAGQPVGFRVDDSKTPSGIREIPIHPALLPIYKKRLQHPQGATQALFPGNDKTKHGLRLNGLSQRFTKLKRKEGFGNKHVFHSFRKCTATLLHQANVPTLVIPFILGHEVGHITFDTYSAGPTLEQKREAICTLPFQFA
ncbi:tyrosine-type recombinase/integrase [Pseudomonas sp. MBLB4136]|uniref:tyrosine-type recombinase/integrase n=1 Tax=Pseudomonas sp. MBLB4136 TaxID=3451558 RepID=UPI003F74F684